VLRVRASTTATVHPAPIVLEHECVAIRLPRNDTLVVLTDDGVLTRWHLAGDGSARKVVSVNAGPARATEARPWDDAMRGFKVVHVRPTHAIFTAPRSNAGLLVATDGALVVFDLDETAPACARFPALGSESPTRCAWLGRQAALLAPDGHIALLGADGSSQMIAPPPKAPVSALDASPDGESLVLGDSAGGVTVCTADGSTIRQWAAHEGTVTAVVWLPNKTEILTAGRDGALRTWNVATGARRGETIVVNRDSGGQLIDVRALGDGALLWVRSTEIRVSRTPWDEEVESISEGTALYATMPAVQEVSWRTPERILVSPDHRWRMNCTSEPPSLEEIRAGERDVIRAAGPAGHAEALVGGTVPMALVPRGKQIEQWSFVVKPTTPLTRCTELRFLSSRVLLSAHRNSSPFVRDVATGHPLGPIGASYWKLDDLYLTSTGRHAVYTEYAAQLMHLDHTVVALGNPPHDLRIPARSEAQTSRHLALVPSGDQFLYVVRMTSPQIVLRDIVTDAIVLEAAEPPPYASAWVLPGEPLRLVLRQSDHRDQPLVVWDVVAGKAITEIAGPTRSAVRICPDTEGTRWITYCPPTLSSAAPLVLWNLATSTCHILDANERKTSCVAFSRDGRSAFTADDTAVTAWDLETFRRSWTLPLTPGLSQSPEHMHERGDLLLVQRGLFGPHLVVRINDGTCLATIPGAHPAPVLTASGPHLFGVIDRGALAIHDSAGTPITRWRGDADANAWAQSPEAPFTIAVGDARGDLSLLELLTKPARQP